MNKVVLITGASTGIGKATALSFAEKGWQVAATMRRPSEAKDLEGRRGIALFELDVTKPATIDSAIKAATDALGPIDVVVNNAGYSLTGPFEDSSPEQIERQFQTNVFGAMNVIRAILPFFRSRRSGVIVNVTSMGGRLTVPLYSVYHATKWALDGFSEALQYELEPFQVRVKIIEPGAIKTDFYTRSADSGASTTGAYDEFTKRAMAKMNETGATGAAPEIVADAILRAASDGSTRLRYPVGSDAKSLLFLRRFISDGMYRSLVRRAVLT